MICFEAKKYFVLTINITKTNFKHFKNISGVKYNYIQRTTDTINKHIGC